MSVKPCYNIDTKNKMATLDLFVDDQFITTYSFANNLITLSERTDITPLSLLNFKENLNGIFLWKGMVMNQLSPAIISSNEFDQEIKKLNNKIKSKYKSSNILVSDIEYNNNTKFVSFAPRVEINFNFTDFSRWLDFLLTNYNYMKDF